MEYIQLKNITFSYENNIFTDFSLNIPAGKRTALLAPSGFGKTTLLFLIAGLLKPQSGQILYPYDNPVFSMIFQENRLLEHASIRRNLTFVQKNLTDMQIQNDMHAVRLSYPLTQKVSSLSGGEKRRVSILRALCADHDILLMDEPFTGLDADTRQDVIDYILQKTAQKTLILVTHDPTDAEALGCEVIRLA